MFQGRGIGEILSHLNRELASLSIITWISLLWKHESQHPFNTTEEVLLLSLDWKDLTISRTAYYKASVKSFSTSFDIKDDLV